MHAIDSLFRVMQQKPKENHFQLESFAINQIKMFFF
jgi:hypothetical protein